MEMEMAHLLNAHFIKVKLSVGPVLGQSGDVTARRTN